MKYIVIFTKDPNQPPEKFAPYYDEEADILDPASARYTVILREAYPERISAYAMGYENADFGNFEISLRYKEWEEDRRGARAGS